MKLFHTADLHADASMEASLPAHKAQERRGELVDAFATVARLASEEGAAVLMAGDIFDGPHPSPLCEARILDVIDQYGDVPFYWLSGNHDPASASALAARDNVFVFSGDGFSSYRLGEVTIWGCEDCTAMPPEMDRSSCNLVLLHGEVSQSAAEGKINLRAWAGRGVDVLALGHYHSYEAQPIDSRGIYVYAGCPAARGFDECGQKGFVEYEYRDGRLTHRFRPLQGRVYHTVEVDVTDLSSVRAVSEAVEASVATVAAKDAVKVELVGRLSSALALSVKGLEQLLSDKVWFGKVKNKTSPALPKVDYTLDVSLAGEFVRTVTELEEDPELREQILLLGLSVLEGNLPKEDQL